LPAAPALPSLNAVAAEDLMEEAASVAAGEADSGAAAEAASAEAGEADFAAAVALVFVEVGEAD
jgi:hypothetical protein